MRSPAQRAEEEDDDDDNEHGLEVEFLGRLHPRQIIMYIRPCYVPHHPHTALSRVKRDNQGPGLGRRLCMLPAASVKCLYINVAFILCYTQIPFTVSLNSCLGSGIFMALNQVSIKGEGENGKESWPTRSRDLC